MYRNIGRDACPKPVGNFFKRCFQIPEGYGVTVVKPRFHKATVLPPGLSGGAVDHSTSFSLTIIFQQYLKKFPLFCSIKMNWHAT